MRLVLGALLGAAGAVAMMRRSPSGHRPPQPGYADDQRAREAERGSDPPAHQQPTGAALHAANGSPVAQEGNQQSKERQYWGRSLRASWATVGAAIAAVWFAARAYETAQDQEIRSLRAYVSVEAAPAAAPIEEDMPGVLVTAENVGQTPAYRVHVLPIVRITGQDDPPAEGGNDGDCEYITRTAEGGQSLARTPFKLRYGIGMSQTERAHAAVASGAYEVRADILICYRDVFGAARRVRVCRRYFPGWDRTTGCRGEQDEYD